jgi:hypothetical protein
MDNRTFTKWLATLAEATNGTLNDAKVAIYYKIFSRYSSDDLTKMFETAIEASNFFPTIAQLKSYLPIKHTAIGLYEEIETTLRSGYGRNDSAGAKQSVSALAWEAIEAVGGWRYFCSADEGIIKSKLFTCCEMISKRFAQMGDKKLLE